MHISSAHLFNNVHPKRVLRLAFPARVDVFADAVSRPRIPSRGAVLSREAARRVPEAERRHRPASNRDADRASGVRLEGDRSALHAAQVSCAEADVLQRLAEIVVGRGEDDERREAARGYGREEMMRFVSNRTARFAGVPNLREDHLFFSPPTNGRICRFIDSRLKKL